MSSGGGYPVVDTTTPGHVAPMPLVSTIQAVRYEHVATVLFAKQSTKATPSRTAVSGPGDSSAMRRRAVHQQHN